MENKKISISLTTVIIISVIIGALVSGLIFYIIYNNMNKDDNFNLSKFEDTQQNLNNSNLNQQPNINDSIDNTNSIDTSNSLNTLNTNSTSQESPLKQEASISGKTSSKSTPLSIGQWGIASKYNNRKYVDVPVKITNITRGNTADQKVKDYCNNSTTIYKYTEPKSDMEWAIIDYTIDLTNIEASYSGEKDIDIQAEICGLEDNNSIHYNNKVYIVSTMKMNAEDSKENIANGKIATQLPIGCTDYIIALGEDSSHTRAYFKGK